MGLDWHILNTFCITDFHSREFSWDIIASEICQSSYSQPPCWFPLGMGLYLKIQQNVPLLFVKFIPNYPITTEWQEYQHTFCSMKLIKGFKHFFIFHSALYKKETKRCCKIVCVCRWVPRHGTSIYFLTYMQKGIICDPYIVMLHFITLRILWPNVSEWEINSELWFWIDLYKNWRN